MTAAELFEIVKDVPRAAWPAKFDYARHYRDLAWGHTEYVSALDPEQAELLFIGSMTKHATSRGYTVTDCCVIKFALCGNIAVSKVEKMYARDTLVEALALACKEAQ